MTYQHYIEQVLTGKTPAGEFIRLAVERHLNDLKRQNTKDFPYFFDEAYGNRFINFAHKCRHWKGEKAREYIMLEPHQQFYFMLLFGWQRASGGRRFRTAFKEIARKNGKTTECAIKALGHLLLDDEAGAQVYFAATKEDQARIGFTDVQEIIKATPGLGKHFRIYTKSVTRGGSFIKPLGSDSNTQDGFDPSYGIIDEYHAHPTAGMLNVLESGMGARRSPLIDVITTAGYNKEFPCYTDLRRTSIEILKGIKQDETHLALIYELDKDDDWRDEATWIKSNPNLGVSVKPDFLRDRFLKAKNEGGSKEVDFKTKNLNIWTDSSHTWIPDDVWQACDGGGLPDLAGRECYGGLDLASVSDWNALVLVFPDDDRVHVKPFYWIPKGKIQKNPERIDYAKMIASGNVFVMEGDAADHALIARDVMEICHTYDVKGIAFDRYLVYSALIQYLKDVALPLHEFGQGFISMSAPTKELERMAYQGRLNHAGDPVLRWMNANVVIRTDPAGNIKIDKDKSTEKVDGMVALAMAIGEMMSHPEKGSIYNNDDFEFLEI